MQRWKAGWSLGTRIGGRWDGICTMPLWGGEGQAPLKKWLLQGWFWCDISITRLLGWRAPPAPLMKSISSHHIYMAPHLTEQVGCPDPRLTFSSLGMSPSNRDNIGKNTWKGHMVHINQIWWALSPTTCTYMYYCNMHQIELSHKYPTKNYMYISTQTTSLKQANHSTAVRSWSSWASSALWR